MTAPIPTRADGHDWARLDRHRHRPHLWRVLANTRHSTDDHGPVIYGKLAASAVDWMLDALQAEHDDLMAAAHDAADEGETPESVAHLESVADGVEYARVALRILSGAHDDKRKAVR